MLLLSASAAHACELEASKLEAKILEDNSLHVLVKCDGVEMFHQDIGFYYPKGGPHDAATNADY